MRHTRSWYSPVGLIAEARRHEQVGGGHVLAGRVEGAATAATAVTPGVGLAAGRRRDPAAAAATAAGSAGSAAARGDERPGPGCRSLR